jgi:NADPH:quinone reductase-like Zn-dependent oxidoreductase
MAMKAVVIRAYGGPEVLTYEERPNPTPGPGEVLIKVFATSVNPADIKLRSGQMKKNWPLTFPAILGLDVSGVIQEIGPGVVGLSVGDKVFANAMQTYASLCVVKAEGLARIPDRMDVIEAAAVPTVTMTGAQLTEVATRGRPTGILVVTGAAGNVGRSAVFRAKERGWVVIAGVRKNQTEAGKATGADRVITLDDEASMKSLEPLDAVADTISGPSADQLIGKVKKGGVFASVLGAPSNAAAYPDVKVETMQVSAAPATLVRMAEAVRDGKLVIPLGQSFGLADASKAHLAAENGAAGKLLLIV